MKHNWSGLLVEPNPDYFKIMESRGRKAWLYPGCFSTKDKPEIVRFDAAGLVGGIEVLNITLLCITLHLALYCEQKFSLRESKFRICDDKLQNTADPSKPKPGEGMDEWVNRRTIEAQCLPIFSIINALDNPR
jgi:hypothetical protein